MIKKILISQPKPSSEKSPYYDIANRFDVELVFRPFIKVEGMSAREFRTQKVSILDHTAVVFTSRHAIDHFFTLAKELRVTIPEDMKYFCVTETSLSISRNMCSIASVRYSSAPPVRWTICCPPW